MKYNTVSKVESFFIEKDPYFKENATLRKIPTLIVDNYVELGQLTALRFLEWVCLNPGGVIALPTGKTPEFFIKWVQFYLKNWEREINEGILAKTGLDKNMYPEMKSLRFFQLDEFFPISPYHERSFTYFIKKFYIDGFGLDPQKAQLIDTYHFNEAQKKLIKAENIQDVFPDGNIDLSLRIKKPNTEQELKKQKVIKIFDQFCSDYENKIRKTGGIGFFLGGIGPDGHIAFNVRGTSHYSDTRLTDINYETQAAAATDLGGIELVRKKAVITIGLETIHHNPDTVAVIMAAGQSKAKVVADAVQSRPSLEYPASSLQKLNASRFFITQSAAIKLHQTEKSLLQQKQKNTLADNFAEKLLISLAANHEIPLMHIANKQLAEIKKINEFKLVEKIAGQKLEKFAEQGYENISNKIQKGIHHPENQRFMHTAPHHDDIELAYFPLLHHLVRSVNNENHFVYCTSGFTSVTNFYVQKRLNELKKHLNTGHINVKEHHKLANYDFAQDDITGYLNGIARQDEDIQSLHISRRVARLFLNYLKTDSPVRLQSFVDEQLALINSIEPGRKEPGIIKQIKSWLREFEAELVWAHFGIDMPFVKHLRLHFYTDDIFPEYPDFDLDVKPILKLMEKIKPTVITLALDPEGSGPDTHYKTLIALSDAIDRYVENHPEMNIKIWGYRNVWSKFHLADCDMIVPVSLNSFAVLHNMFNSCFLSQKSASFPSYELDGTFSALAQKIWVQQHNKLVKLLGRDYFYSSTNPLLKRAYGAILLKVMSYQDFKNHMKSVKRLLKSKQGLEL